MIELHHLSKSYRSRLGGRAVHALDDVTLTLARGEVVGIAGPNGAGKSTLISLALGFLAPSTGTVRIDGVAPRAYVERHGASYLTELVSLPPKWRVDAALLRFAVLADLPPAVRRPRVEALLAELELVEHRQKQVRQLSKGNLQRLGLAQALLADSDLVILDEPTHGLDPLWTQRFRDVVRALRRPGRVIVIASHNLDELERLTDRVVILHQGRMQRIVGGADASRQGGAYRLTLAEVHPGVSAAFPGAEPVGGRLFEWRVEGELAALSRGLAALLAAGAVLVAFEPEQSRLETEFRAAVGAPE